MRRRYSIHRDGDLLVEELDAAGKPIEPDPVPAEDRLPIEVVLLSPDDEGARGALLDLIEMVWEFESFGPDEGGGPPPKSLKLNVLS
jgi:hypothetical protein